MSSVMMLDHLGERSAARSIQAALEKSIAKATHHADVGGKAGTAEFTDAVIGALS